MYQEYVKLSEFKNKEINLKAENTSANEDRTKLEHWWEHANSADTLEDSLTAPDKVKHTLVGIFLRET